MRQSVAPFDQSTDAFLLLVDALDAEANAVTHAVVRAQATVRSIVDDARLLLEQPEPDERAWAEVGVRLMQHRAVLMDALASLCRTGNDHAANRPSPVAAVSTPVPPRTMGTPAVPARDDGGANDSAAAVGAGPMDIPTAPPAPSVDSITIPEPPRARLRPVAPANAITPAVSGGDHRDQLRGVGPVPQGGGSPRRELAARNS